MKCVIDQCKRMAVARGWCNTHYRRWHRHGDPLAVTRPRRRTFNELVGRRTDNECWPWLGTRTAANYGFFYVGRGRKGVKYVLAHRLAWEKANRPLRPGEIVLHLCDNPPCVNPAHLRAGSYADNMQDAAMKGRMQRRPGEKHPLARLTTADIREIRMLASTMTQAAIAKRFGVHQSHVSNIVRRKVWTHI